MKNIASIQVLRALAALSVAASHYDLFYSFNVPSAYYPFAFGEAGVDLFFVISGFIMVYASASLYGRPNVVATFVKRRLIRIVPIYWLATTAYLLVAVAAPQMQKNAAVDFVLASYFFIPFARPDGAMQPLVGQGWSLNYEMLFYGIFAVALFTPRRIAVAAASLVVIGLGAAGHMIEFTNPLLKFWTSEIIIEFAFGMMIGLAYLEGLRLPRWVALGLLIVGVVLFLSAPQMHAVLGGRLIPWGLPAAAMLMGAVFGDFSLTGFGWRLPLLVGEASYSLYLSHAVVIRASFALLRHFGIALPFWPGLALAMMFCIAVAIVLYYLVERPLTQILQRRFAGQSKPLTSEGIPALS